MCAKHGCIGYEIGNGIVTYFTFIGTLNIVTLLSYLVCDIILGALTEDLFEHLSHLFVARFGWRVSHFEAFVGRDFKFRNHIDSESDRGALPTFNLTLIELDDSKNLKLGASHTLLMGL